MAREVLKSKQVVEIQKKRRRILYWKLFALTLLFIGLLIGLSYASKSKRITINNIEIVGNKVITTEEIKNIIEEQISGNYLIFAKRNIFIYPKKNISKALLSKYSRISNLEIDLVEINNLRVKINEREPSYVWCNEKCYFLDTKGYIFDRAPIFSGPIYLKFLGPQGLSSIIDPIGQVVLDSETFTRIINFSNSLREIDNLLKIEEVMIGENDTFDFVLKNKALIKFKKENNLQTILQNLQTAISAEPLKTDFHKNFNNLEYLDLRFDDKVYYKFKS